MFNIILTAPLSEDGLHILQSASDVSLYPVTENPAAVLPHLPTAHALIVGDGLIIDSALLDAAPNLRLIGRLGAALNNVDVETATRRGIIVMNVPGVDAVTVAEYTFALMFALLRNVLGGHHDLRGETANKIPIGTQLKGKTLGIIGYGRVGQELAPRALAFGLNIIVSDPYISESRVAHLQIKLVGMNELLQKADIITLHTSLVPDTERFINAATLAQMKKGVFLINAKHHSFIDTPALLDALNSGQVAGYAADDFDPDQLQENPLMGHPKVIHTQRMRFNTYEAQNDLSTVLAPQVLDALRGEDYRNAVNLPFMPGSEYENITPQLHLAEKIGRLLHHLGHRTVVERVEIHTRGEEMQGLLKPLTVALLKGLLAPRLGEIVNYINAPILANERGIVVTTSKGMGISSYPNLLSCQVFWKDGFELIVAGAIFNQTEPRIVQVDQYRTDFTPEGTLIIMGSYDVPGVIGKVGTYMADHQINIAGWRTSRVTKGGNTLSIISIDEPLSDALLTDLQSKEFVRHATQVSF